VVLIQSDYCNKIKKFSFAFIEIKVSHLNILLNYVCMSRHSKNLKRTYPCDENSRQFAHNPKTIVCLKNSRLTGMYIYKLVYWCIWHMSL